MAMPEPIMAKELGLVYGEYVTESLLNVLCTIDISAISFAFSWDHA
jgi:hypothetical protein